jgi:L-2,4-diaminobutyric acid acetyltransferase
VEKLMTSSRRSPQPTVAIRPPRASDGAAVWRLIRDTDALDDNSLYCNLLQCSHFSATCAVAEMQSEVVGWMSGYVPPDKPDTLFVWQICVGEQARGRGLARRLIADVLARPESAEVQHIECTITADNAASWGLFEAIARQLGARLARRTHFSRDVHFDGLHDSEFQVTIGPFDKDAAAVSIAA